MSGQLQLSVVNVYKGAYIIFEGKPSNGKFFIIKKGTVEVSRNDASVVETLNPGDFFGVISAMSNRKYIETVIAQTDVSLIVVNKNQFPILIQKNTPIAMKIILSFSKRLRVLDKSIAELSTESRTTSIEDVVNLYNIGDYYYQQKQYNQAFYAFSKFVQHCENNDFVSKAKEILSEIKDKAHDQFEYLNPKADDFKRVYKDNTMICCEHEPGNELFIIQEGQIKITKVIQNKEVLLAVLKEGDIFGEMALIENKPRSASAIAFGTTKVMAVNKNNFEAMISNQPQLVARLISLLAERTWVVYRQLTNLTKTDLQARFYDMLLIQIEKEKVDIYPKDSYTFNFGPKELITMVGVDQTVGKEYINEIFKKDKFSLKDGKIHLSEIDELIKINNYYTKVDELKRRDRSK